MAIKSILDIQRDQAAVSDPTATVKTPSSTNESQSDQDRLTAYENSTAGNAVDNSQSLSKESQVLLGESGIAPGNRVVPPGAQPKTRPEPIIKIGLEDKEDLRVKIRVPAGYLNDITTGPKNGLGVGNIGGVIFPYTPTISFDMKADYTSSNPVHSNFSINFYKSSSISAINIAGKFTVENDSDAGFYIATVHLLRSLTRMRFGQDWNKGAPPPICRLDAYGKMMLKNVPVAITMFKTELPDNVDYYTIDYLNQGQISVPTSSIINVSCLPMYSRAEMQQFSVTSYLEGGFKDKGII